MIKEATVQYSLVKFTAEEIADKLHYLLVTFQKSRQIKGWL